MYIKEQKALCAGQVNYSSVPNGSFMHSLAQSFHGTFVEQQACVEVFSCTPDLCTSSTIGTCTNSSSHSRAIWQAALQAVSCTQTKFRRVKPGGRNISQISHLSDYPSFSHSFQTQSSAQWESYPILKPLHSGQEWHNNNLSSTMVAIVSCSLIPLRFLTSRSVH